MKEPSIYARIYRKVILDRPKITLALLLIIFTLLGLQIRNFRLDASADSLILEHDKDLRYSRKINDRYATLEFVLMTYTPKKELFSPESLNEIKKLREELRGLERVSSVVTILDVPLLSTPPVPLSEIKNNLKTLETQWVDTEMAKKEIGESPIYRELLVSEDLKSCTIQINFTKDEAYDKVAKRRSALIMNRHDDTITPDEDRELEELTAEYLILKDRANEQMHKDIADVRTIMERYKDSGELFLGGVPMISDDMITFVKNDIKTFGIGMIFLLIITMGTIFRRTRWVILPMLCCAFSVIAMAGLVSLFGWQVTVISSNFISLQLVITMALTIHLVVKYNELYNEEPERDHKELVFDSVRAMITPCIFTTTTTIAGFASLIYSDILPVINFGWMMSIGLVVSMAVTFILFPVVLTLLPQGEYKPKREFGERLTSFYARFTRDHAPTIYVAAALILILTFVGISRIEMENSFIDYFRESTEIYRGMKMIDQRLGGTTPLDLTIDFEQPKETPTAEKANVVNGDELFADFEEFDRAEKDTTYWYTPDKLETVEKVHTYLDGIKEVGKVLSLKTMLDVIKKINEGKSLDNLDMTLLINELPQEFKDIIVDPYASPKDNQARISIRIKDSMPSLRRDALLKKIKYDLTHELGLKEGQARLTGVMVLYNNMLQSLYHSQIETIGFTIAALMLMFLVLFRSFKISFIAIFPNILSSGMVLGVMGLFGIPLDMMTITIVAIAVGIAVDDTIHYIHRFEEEFQLDRNYMDTMFRCHASIGNAMYYTSIAIIIGFSILVLSNFIPSVLFGLLTGLAMVMAIVAALTLLPSLIMLLKPFGPEGQLEKESPL
ncbi:MAG: MMPL family transporter [Nitrospinae bacterium]|nr:MMPL family transporter [Nitrospinota bacterium]